jgi:hypothetical protein
MVIANAVGAAREFYLLQSTGALDSSDAKDALFRCGSVLFEKYCRTLDRELVDLTSTGLLEHLASLRRSWAALKQVLANAPQTDAVWEACLGPGTVDLRPQLSELQDVKHRVSSISRLPTGLASNLQILLKWLESIASDSRLGLALIEEW